MNENENRLPVLNSLLIILQYAVGYNWLYPAIIRYLYGKGYVVRGTYIPEIIAYLFVFVTTVWLSWPLLKYGWKKYVENFPKNIKMVIAGLIMMMGSVLLISSVIYLATGQMSSSNESAVDTVRKDNLLYFAFASVAVAPVVEEMVFRGCLYNLLNRWMPKLPAAIIASLLFGFLHVYDSIFTGNYLDLVYIVLYGALGYVLNYLYIRTDSIICPILLHMLNNSLGLLK